MALSRLPAATLAWSTSSASLSSSMIVSARHCLHLSRCWMHIPLTHAAFTCALIRASPIPRKFYFSLTPHRVAFGIVQEPRRRSRGTRLPRRAWLRGSQSSELCPRLGDLRRFPTNYPTLQLLARGGRPPSDRRLARPSRSANSRARAVACGRKLAAREPAGLRGRVRRRGAPSHAAAHASCALAALQATHGARYGREAH